MAKFTTGESVPDDRHGTVTPEPRIVDPVTELDAKVRALLHEVSRLQVDDEAFDTAYDELQHDLARLQDEWKRLQTRVQQVFTMIAIVRRALVRA